jgi:hypothetical protein
MVADVLLLKRIIENPERKAILVLPYVVSSIAYEGSSNHLHLHLGHSSPHLGRFDASTSASLGPKPHMEETAETNPRYGILWW